MEKFLKKYGVILLLYFVLVCGILLLNERCRMLNNTQIDNNGSSLTGFPK